MDEPSIVEDDAPSIPARVEASIWGLSCRVGIRIMRLERFVAILDRVPRRRSQPATVAVPANRHFRGGGACLSRSLARSQYLRVRGVESTVAIGVAGSVADLDAHAWLEPLDAPGHHEALHTIAR